MLHKSHKVLLACFVACLLATVTSARTYALESTVEDKGARVNTHAQRAHVPTCTRRDGNTPILSYYLYPDDGTALQVAYSDYLEDLTHWYTVTPDACRVPTPEAFPAQ